MGGINSGQGRTANRGSVEHFPAIDLRILKRASLLRPDECTYDTLKWRNQASHASSARIFIDLSDRRAAYIKIAGHSDETVVNQRVQMDCVPVRFGGFRYYFVCPMTGRRCELLYLVDGVFASRQAHAVTYSSQTQDKLSRARQKVRKLQRQIDGDNRYARPRRQNRWRIMQKLNMALIDADDAYRERLRSLLGNYK